MPIAAQHLRAARLHLQKSDPVMKRIIKAVGPCNVKIKTNRFQMLVASIIGQQISGNAARTIYNRLLDAIESKSIKPEHLVGYTVEELRELGVSRQKATYLIDLAEKVDGGQVMLTKFAKMENEEVIEQLTQVKGVGRWTAQMFLMFSLGRLDVFPVDDLGIKNAIILNYKLRKEPDKKRMEKIAAPWNPFETIASWYLWQSLELPKA